MSDYYRLLGVPRAATPAEIKRAYRELSEQAADSEAARARQQAAAEGLPTLTDPALRRAYDEWLRQQPDTRPPAMRARDEEREQLVGYARVARKVLLGLAVFVLLLALDWALPLREYTREAVLERRVVSVGASMSDPQLGYAFRTPHTSFQLHSRQALIIRDANYLTVWQTPLLRVVRLIDVPERRTGQLPLRPYNGAIYQTSFGWVPVLLLLCTAAGLLPSISPELRINLAVAGSLLLLLTLGVLLFF
ncbi:J domain-containing protein [Hymenobacter gummosus]|nr:DnaJ domain-containing protein [Hymenobacter gummosus]